MKTICTFKIMARPFKIQSLPCKNTHFSEFWVYFLLFIVIIYICL